MKLQELKSSFQNVSLPGPFGEFANYIVRSSDGRTPSPYLPYVGDSYQKYGVLFYLTAQNLAKKDSLVQKFCDYPEQALTRLEYGWDGALPEHLSGSNIHSGVELGPVKGGVIPAMVAIYLKARYDIEIQSVDEAMNNLAVTNFYKLSLAREGNDFNPKHLGEKSRIYAQLMFDVYIAQELNALKPRVVFCFKGKSFSVIREALNKREVGPFDLFEINDTAWILRGGGKCLTKGGSWDHNVPALDPLLTNIEAWLGRSYKGKKEQIERYLRHYYLEFSKNKEQVIA